MNTAAVIDIYQSSYLIVGNTSFQMHMEYSQNM